MCEPVIVTLGPATGFDFYDDLHVAESFLVDPALMKKLQLMPDLAAYIYLLYPV